MNSHSRIRTITLAAILLAATLAAMAVPVAAALPPEGSFVDDNGNVHEGNIEAIKAAGITKGCNPPVNDKYCPADSVTRGQMAAFLVRALDLSPSQTDHFTDDASSVFEADINSLADADITRGCNPPANDRYCPDGLVTRGQMAAFLVRAFGYSDPGQGDWFVDDDLSIFENDIDRLRQAGVTLGCNPPVNDNYCPARTVRRDEMASFLSRALGLPPVYLPPQSEVCEGPPEEDNPTRQIIVTPGQSPTLTEAFADARAGDHIVLAAGLHKPPSDDLVMTASGTDAEWIEIHPVPGAVPVIDLEGQGELRIEGSYVGLRGLEIRNGGGNNVHIAPGSADIHHIYVGDSVIHDLAAGPGAAIKINRNNPMGTGVGTVCIDSNDLSDAIGNAVIDGVGVDGAVVIGNDIHDNAPGSQGIFFKGGSADILIEGNVIRGIRGNAALQLGGDTGAAFWNPKYPTWEGVNQVARSNIVADFDDSAVEIRGVNGAFVYNNTIVTQSSFAIFRLQSGSSSLGGSSGNDNVSISSNLVVGTGGDPQYARNDAGTASITFGPQLWAGDFHNSGSPTPGIPAFPQTVDVVVDAAALDTVVHDPRVEGLVSFLDAVNRFAPADSSPALGAAEVLASVVTDLLGEDRSSTEPTIGAIETP